MVRIIGFFVVLYIILLIVNFITPILYSDQVTLFIKTDRELGFAVYIVLFLIAQIFPLIPDFPLQILAIGLFGVTDTILLSFVLSMISSTITFFIARQFGRKFVKRFIGQSRFERIQHISSVLGVKELIIIRFFEVSLFEWISYAAGLTELAFPLYLGITIAATLPYYLIFLFLARAIPDLGKLYVTISIITYCAALIPIPYFLKKRKKVNRIN